MPGLEVQTPAFAGFRMRANCNLRSGIGRGWWSRNPPFQRQTQARAGGRLLF
jgi:hypothetical protein